MHTQEYDDRVVLIILGVATVICLVVGIVQPFWPMVVGAAISLWAFAMLVRTRGTLPLRESWWTTVGAIAVPVSVSLYVLVDALRSGMTLSHWLVFVTFGMYIAIFVVPQALARRRNRP